MAPRPVLRVLLATTAVAATAAVAFVGLAHERDQADARAAVAAAHRVVVPADATRSHECRGDGLVLCFVDPSPATPVAARLAQTLRTAAGKPASVDCSPVSSGAAAGFDSCLVAVRWDHHGAFAFVDPHLTRGDAGPHVDGTLVAVSTG